MAKVEFDKAYFIKLGTEGVWEDSSIREGKLRIGWEDIQWEELDNLNWAAIEQSIRERQSRRGEQASSARPSDKGTATRDINALKNLVNSDSSTIWITFHKSTLWWCKLKGTGVKHDAKSNYLEVDGAWSNENSEGKALYANHIPGSISQIQGFRATACKVSNVGTLRRVINAEPSHQSEDVTDSMGALVKNLAALIKELHWKDFELLVDLVFRHSGWKRVSMLGKSMKYADIEFEDVINGYHYQVQVKSTASLQNFTEYADQFDGEAFHRLFYVVHSPDNTLKKHVSPYDNVKLIMDEGLAKMVVDAGLVDWVLERAP